MAVDQANVTCTVSTWPRAIAIVRWLVGHGFLRLAQKVPIAHARIGREGWLVRWRPGSTWLDMDLYRIPVLIDPVRGA